MILVRATCLALLLSFTLAELKCEWEYKDKCYLPGWTSGSTRAVKYATLKEAQDVCLTLGDNCGGVTLWNGGYTCREGKEYTDHSKEQSWRKTCMGVPLFRVASITPNKGSRMGGTRIIITGQGFSTNQFGYAEEDKSLGNKVTFYQKDETQPPIQCHVQTYYTSSTRIVCDMTKPDVYWLDNIEYRLKVSVDGTWMDPKGTSIYCGGACTFWIQKGYTPKISSTGMSHLPAGSVLTMSGTLWTDAFEPSTDVSSDGDYIKRVYLNSFTCDTSDDNGNSYGTDLEVDDNGEDTSKGSIMCKSENPGATSYRPSFLHSRYGRSEVSASASKVDSQMQKYAFQTYNVLKTVSPTEGSTNGGTKVTITSEHVVGPASNIKVDVGGNDCAVDSFTSEQIVCSSPAKEERSVYPGNRGVTVEYWKKEDDKSIGDARGLDVDLIKGFKQDAANFLFEKIRMDARPETLKDITSDGKEEPYYVRMKFFLSIQETDFYGFNMISDHSGKLYVSTDENPANVVLKAECTSAEDNWNVLQTEIDTRLEAGKLYYVEFVGVMWNYGQDFSVGMTKKTTPYQPYDVTTSKKDFPYWYWTQEYRDELQTINLGELIKTPSQGFKLKVGERETTTLYASSTVEQIQDAITDTAVYKCPTLDAADAWYSVDFENGDMSYTGGWARNYIEPYCGRWVAINTWAIFHVKYEKKVYEWDPSRGYKYLCFALKTKQPRVTLYYELLYEDSNYNWQNRGIWRGVDETPELQDNDGTWKYNCIDMIERVKTTDAVHWDNLIGSRKWKVRNVQLGYQYNGKSRNWNCKKFMKIMDDACIYTDAIRILKTNVTETARVKGFALTGEGLLESVVVEIHDYCADGTDCTTQNNDQATERKWSVAMNTHECAYNFPLIGISGAKETVVTANTKSTYPVGGKTVEIVRTHPITPDLQGTFDLTIDGTTYSNIDVHITDRGLYDMVKANGEYQWAHRWGSCYERHWRLERLYSGHHGWHEVDSTNVVGVGELKTYVKFRDNERGGLVMNPLSGDWVRTASSTPQVAVKVGGIQALCDSTCGYTPSDAQTPTVASLSAASGSRGQNIVITGTGFGTTANQVSVTIGGASQRVDQVTATTVNIQLQGGVSKAYAAADIVVNVVGKGNAKVDGAVVFTYNGVASAINPATGSVGGGTLVTITGSGFDPDNSGVSFSGTAGKIKSATYQEIQVYAPPGAAGTATIVISGGAGFVAIDTSGLVYNYITTNVPTVSSIQPTSGSVVGGTVVTITGTNLETVTDDGVTIGGVKCTKDAGQASTATKFYCTTGGGSPGSKLLAMATSTGEFAQSSATFSYLLEVKSVSPNRGSVIGGTVVTIKGSGFGTDKDKLDVMFGEYECEVESVQDDKIMCTTEPAINVDQLWADYTSIPSCVIATLTGIQQTVQHTHNMYRRRHKDTSDICYSSEVAKTAISWAAYLTENDVFKSSSTSYRENRGENLMMFQHWDLKSDEAYMRDAISAWYAEGGVYKANDPSKALRYTQVLWSMSKEVGCAVTKKRASPADKYKVYVVCHYSPAGNTEGKFVDYVNPFNTANHRVAAALSSKSVAVEVFLDTHKAVVNKVTPSADGGCSPVTSKVTGCTDIAPTAVSADYEFSYYSCYTPKITSVSREGFWNDDITIDGKGFSTRKCAVTVKLGADHVCTVQTLTDTKITCKPDIVTKPPVYTLFEVKVNVLGRGDAIFEGEQFEEHAYTSIKPKITSISPMEGSSKGGRTIQINGGGFKYEDNKIAGSVSDGVTEFEILGATYTSVSVRSRSGITETVDTQKTITLTQDAVAVDCDQDKCLYDYKVTKTPTVTNVAKAAKSSGFAITIDGTLLCPGGTGTTVMVGESSCTITTCTDAQIVCDVQVLPAGTYNFVVSMAYGYANIADGFKTIQFDYTITTVAPVSGSIYGGTTVTITGTGLPTGEDLRVRTSTYELTIVSKTTSEIVAVTQNRKVSDDTKENIEVLVDSAFSDTAYEFSYITGNSPLVTDISPAQGTHGAEITITGDNLLSSDADKAKTKVLVGDSGSLFCTTTTVTKTEIKCTLPHASIKESLVIQVKVEPMGDSNADKAIKYTMVLGATVPASPTTGSLGGPTISLQGSGFPFGKGVAVRAGAAVSVVDVEVRSLTVTVCGVKVEAEVVSSSELSITLPACPADVCTGATHACDIVVDYGSTLSKVDAVTLTKASAVTYTTANTPQISNIDPDNAGTGGGKTITISGTGFSDQTSDVSVKFDNVACVVQTATTTQIVCKTGPKTDLKNKDGVAVRIKESLAVNTQEKKMTYMDKWSSKFTWGGSLDNKPKEGDMAVLTEGQIIYLDESPPKLKALLLRGGHLIFDDNQDLILKAEYILILTGGSITIGTEDTPFTHQAIIEMYGHQQSIELPMYGAKTLAVRNGTVEMHGVEVTPKWCNLGETAEAGATSIVVKQDTNWKIGDQIALSASGFAPEENEEFTITSINYDPGTTKTTLGLNKALKYKHISLVQTIRGKTITTAAKVGHLTRNVKMRGNVNADHLEEVDACPQTFDPDQFATQTCFQGRYGAMMDSDQFGSQIMFHSAAMGTREVHGRLENVEFTWAGQAFRLGRYPIHYHMNGDVSGSYVKGCAIHHTFNRAVTVHGVDNLLVKDNVAFNNLGHAFFLEDGIEENNIFDGNLAIFTQSSSSLLNVDVTPASFWIVNPQNTFINNVAAGSTHFGFWFNMPEHPGGPSATSEVCPRNKGMKEFRNNEAHSCGRYGIWVWEFWNPRGDGSCDAKIPQLTTLHDFHAWHNLRGVEIETGSGIAMDNFVLHDNWHSQMEVHKCFDATFEEGNTRMTNSQIYSKTKSSDGLQLLYMPEGQRDFKCGTGVKLPGKGMYSIYDTTFHDFTSCPVFEACGGCKKKQGGFPIEFKGITYENSPIKAKFQWEFEAILRDLDGTLSGSGVKNGIITPNMPILDKTSCSKSDAWSHGAAEGMVCDAKTSLVRLAWNEPSLEFLNFKKVMLTNIHGMVDVDWIFKRMTHMKGWMATVPAGNKYTMKWDTDYKFTNASYKMTAYYPKDGDYVVLEQVLNDKPDYITVGGSSNKKLEPIDGATDAPGTFTFDDENKKLSHLITGQGITTTKELPMDLKVYKCFYTNCTDPHPKPLPSNPTIQQRPESPKRWSVSSDWMGTEEGKGGHNGILPQVGDDVVIPSSWWMVYDASMEGIGDIFVYGVLEFSSEEDTLLGANRIVVVGGKIVIGWADEPLRVKATIRLTGSRDDKEYTLNDGTTVGSKALAIIGFAEIHAVVPDVVWSTITAKAPAGSTAITLKDNVEDKWKVGDEIAIASTSFIPSEAEKRKITKVEGHTLTLDKALEFDHDYLKENIHEHVYERAAEVGLLTRPIVIEGVEDAGHKANYGGRVLASDYSQVNEAGQREEYIPVVQFQGVQFKNSGQMMYRDYWDPRYSLALQNVDPSSKSYIKSCSIDGGFNHGFGILGSHNVDVLDNVIYAPMGSGVITNSENTNIAGNLVINMISYGNYENPVENDNYFMDACFQTYETAKVTLKNNNCGGSERAGFATMGEESSSNIWENNVAHSCLWGFFIRKASIEVTKLNKISAWQNYDYGVVHWSASSLVIQNSVFADNGFSVLPQIIGPNPLNHDAGDKYVTYTDTLIYGRNTNSNCDERATNRPPTAKLTGIGYHAPSSAKGGYLGLYLSNFLGGFPGWPKKPVQKPMSYSSIKGLTTLTRVTFANFDRCNDMAMMDLKGNGDCYHPTKLSGMKYSSVSMEDNFFLMHNPQLGFVNSADCVDMSCDAKKKVLITDMDGSTLGAAGDTLTSRSEFEWDGDARYGTGDYRIPNTATTALDGSKIDPKTTWPYKGIDRRKNGKEVCEYKSNLNMYKCSGVTYKMLIIESMDGDTELRRLSPLALVTDDGSVDLINGPMDHGWCGGYTCQQRISTFYALVQLDKEYKLYLTSTQPQSMRYQLVDAAGYQKIKLDIWYAKSQRLDVYYEGKYKAPTNAKKKNDGTYSYVTDKTAAELYPKLSDPSGTNFFDSKAHWLSMLIKGSKPFTIKTSPKIVLSLTLESVDASGFFDEDKIVENLAALLGVDKSKIKIAKIVSEGRRKRAGSQEFQIEISEPAIEDDAAMDVAKVTKMAKTLTEASEKFVESVQRGELGKVLEADVKSVSVQLPEIPPADSRDMKIDKEEAEKVTETTYAEKQAEEQAAKIENSASIAVLIPAAYKLIDASKKVAMLTNLALRSKVVTSDQTVVPLLGAGEKKWRASLSVVDGPKHGRVLGTKEVTFTNGFGNLTDVRISRKGSYKFKLAVTYPTDLSHEIEDIEIEIEEQDPDSPYTRVSFKFDADYEDVVASDPEGFTTYIRGLLKEKFPSYVFEDIDHYAGSLVVETTVSTSSGKKEDTKAAVKRMAEDTKDGFDLSYNGKTVKLDKFSGDASSGGSNTAVAVAVPVVLIALLAALAAGGFFVYKKKQNRISERITMSSVKQVEDDPALTRNDKGSNIYSNRTVVVDVNCESNSQLVDNGNEQPLSKVAVNVVHERQEQLKNLRRRSLQKVWGALNRMDSTGSGPNYKPMSDDELCELDLEGSRPGTGDTWRERRSEVTECATCHESKKTWPCPICSGPRYCSKGCLDKNWAEHHTQCRPRTGQSVQSQ